MRAVPAVDPRDQRIAELEALVAKLMARIEMQDARIAELEAQLRQNSRNSSKPCAQGRPKASVLFPAFVIVMQVLTEHFTTAFIRAQLVQSVMFMRLI